MTVKTETHIDQLNLEATFANLKSQAQLQRSEKISKRKDRLKRMLQWIEEHESLIKTALYADFKKPASEVDLAEILPVTTEIKHALNHLNNWVQPKKVDTPLTLLGSTSHIQYEPKGACLIISPWNFPFNLALAPLVSCLAAGNTAMVKPSEMTPNTAKLIQEMISDLFAPNEVSVVLGGVEASQSLLKLPFDHIFFTGSPQVGKIVMRAAAEHLASVTLELGGKSPAIIDQSTNIGDAAEKLAWGKFLNNGQTCIAPDYLLVHDSIQDRFLEELTAKVQGQFNANGNGFHNSPDYGRIVNRSHYNRLNELLQDALAKGAHLVMGDNAIEEENHIPPVILKNVPMDTRLMEEEVFGPILPVITFSSLDDAIQLINAKPKPLALYYFGKSSKAKKIMLHETSSGGVCINDCVLHFTHSNLPFGGVNNSGIGKSHGYFGFLAFSNKKGVLKQRIGLTSSKMIYPPYSKFTRSILSIIKKYL
ncbi:MAG TPA: aldehyde dehydrogenase family protein [Fulvivirga sp.]|nr:aldehyde dehydrogenase family protein [Fulvivirga sp.]